MTGSLLPMTEGEPADTSGDRSHFEKVRFQGRRVEPRRFRNSTANSPSPLGSAGSSTAIPAPQSSAAHKDTVPCENLIFAQRLLANAGMNASAYRIGPLLRRIPACLRALRMSSVSAAMKALKDDPERIKLALSHLLIGSTSFFRDEVVFRQLECEVIPRLIEKNRCVRVWSAACSDGSELYSVAMLFDLLGASGHSYFQGTDCRDSVLAAARRGVYHPALVRDIRPDLAARYLRPHGQLSAVIPEIVEQVRWKQDDVLVDAPRGLWDMILCRNLAIYLGPETCESLWKRLVHGLTQGGILVVGRAEKPNVSGLIRIGPCIYQKIGFPSKL